MNHVRDPFGLLLTYIDTVRHRLAGQLSLQACTELIREPGDVTIVRGDA